MLQTSHRSTTVLWLGAGVMAAALTGCGRADNGSRAARPDRPGPLVVQEVTRPPATGEASAERKAEEVRSELGRVGIEAAPGEAVEASANKPRDAAISASIKRELAMDRQLRALGIEVDTAGGRVLLHGSAPDAAARERATRLARNVDGVRSVDNLLTVDPNV